MAASTLPVFVLHKHMEELTIHELLQIEEFIYEIVNLSRPIDVYYTVFIETDMFLIQSYREIEDRRIYINIPADMRQRNAGKTYRVSDSLEIEFSQT